MSYIAAKEPAPPVIAISFRVILTVVDAGYFKKIPDPLFVFRLLLIVFNPPHSPHPKQKAALAHGSRCQIDLSVVAPQPHAAALKFVLFADPLRHGVIRRQVLVAARHILIIARPGAGIPGAQAKQTKL